MHSIIAFFVALVVGVGSLLGFPSAIHEQTDTQLAASSTSSASPLDALRSAAAGIFSSDSSSSSAALPTGSSWLTTVPLGDNKYTTSSPKKGYIYLCNVQSGGKGAQVNGPWIHGSTWNPSEKIHVQGSVSWPQATYSMKIMNGKRTISSNDLPIDHTTGTFPVAASDPAAAYDRNQGTITAHPYTFTFTAYPAPLTNPGCIYGEVGILNNGVLLFDGFDALYRDALAHELQDTYDGHPNNEGYHDHGFISEIKNLAVSKVVGFAFDGYPITGPLLPTGKYLTTNDLDECHGITSSIMLDGKMQSSYHYVLTQDFPYSVGCFRGKSTVTPGMLRAQGLGTNSVPASQQTGQAQGTNPPAPPQEAISACSGKESGTSCTVGQQMTGTCSMIGSYFACVPR